MKFHYRGREKNPLRDLEATSDKKSRETSGTRAVMFDLDDTLINSTIDFLKIRRKTIDFCYSLGVPADALSIEMKTYEIVEKAISELRKRGLTDSECSDIVGDVSRLWNQVEMENVQETSPVEGAGETRRKLKERGYKIGVVTRSCREYALKALEVAGLLGFVDVIVARDDCVKSKPDSEPLAQGMRLLGSKAEETIMVGDSVTDFQCSRDAGVKFIGVLNKKEFLKTLDRKGRFAIIQSLRELADMVA